MRTQAHGAAKARGRPQVTNLLRKILQDTGLATATAAVADSHEDRELPKPPQSLPDPSMMALMPWVEKATTSSDWLSKLQYLACKSMSNSQMASVCGVDDKTLKERFQCLGAQTLKVQAQEMKQVRRFFKQCEDEGFKLVHFALKRKYDETPMKVRIEALTKKGYCEEDTLCSKLVQTESMWGAVLFDKDGNEHMFFGEVVNAVQAIENNDGACLFVCQMQTEASEILKSMEEVKFETKTELINTDDLAANHMGERGVAAARPDGWGSEHTVCDAHKMDRISQGTYDIDAEFRTGVVSYGLSFQVAGPLRQVREWLRNWIDEGNVKIYVGNAGEHAKKHRMSMLNTFLPLPEVRGKKNRCVFQRRAILETWCNGNWEDEGPFQHFVRDIELYLRDKEAYTRAVHNAFSQGVVWALYGRAPHIFKNKEWNGGFLAISDQALPIAIHGVGKTAYISVMGTTKKKKPTVAPGIAVDMPMLHDLVAPVEGEAAGVAAGMAEGAIVPFVAVAPEERPTGNLYEQQSQFRQQAIRVLERKDLLGRLVSMRKNNEPERIAMIEILKTNSLAWAKREEKKMLLGSKTRQYKLGVAGSCKGETDLLCAVAKNMRNVDGVAWNMMPSHMYRASHCTFVWRQSSRSGGGGFLLLYVRHKSHPYRYYYKVLHCGSEGAAEVEKDNLCMCTQNVEKQIVMYKGKPGGLAGKHAMSKTRLEGHLLDGDTHSVELRHARLTSCTKTLLNWIP